MKREFYLKDESVTSISGSVKVKKDCLFFRAPVKSHGGAAPEVFDDRAVAQHVKDYPLEFEAFMKEHEGYVLPWDRPAVA